VGVLHLVPSLELFPLLADPKGYEPNTVDLGDPNELQYWFTILSDHSPDLVDKAVASEGGTDDAKRRGDAFARAFRAHLARLKEEPAAYGKLGLANLLELREECLREFHFSDAYKTIKQRENEASLAVLQDLLMELDSMDEEKRLLALIEGVLAANIFDWGSRACVELYHKGTIIEIYRMSRKKMQRPWRVDNFDTFKERMLGSGGEKPKPHKRALLFVDNSGADIVLGMLPLTRELLRRGTEVVLVANSLPALNDVTASELPTIVAEAAKHCDILRKAAEAGGLLVDAMVTDREESVQNVSSVPRLMVVENGCGSPCIDFRQVSSDLAAAANEADLVILEGMGRALHTNFNARFKCEALKLAMVKNQRLAEKIVNGNIYDCICRYEPAV
jgi:type II pantothenate kinase